MCVEDMAKSMHIADFWPTEKGLRHPIGSFRSVSERIAESDLQEVDARVKSFHFCPRLDPARAKELAEAGLYFTGNRHGFVVACAGCRFSHSGPIAKATNLIDLHAFGSSISDSEYLGCPFGAKVAAATAASSSKEGKQKKKKKKKKNKNKKKYEQKTENPPHSEVESQEKRQKLKEKDNRVATFRGNWPKDMPVTAEELAEAGFYFVGPNDKVACPFCNGRIFNWDEDDSPLEVHTRWFPICPFVKKVMVAQPGSWV